MTPIAELIAAHRPGHALPGGLYLRPDVFALDLELLLARWTCVGHASEAPEPGDWLTASLGAESAIVVRGEDGQLRALANVCRHRGSRICAAAHGSGPALTCPYHAWTYRLDGSLRAAREMPPDFRPEDHSLASLPTAVVGGLIFIAFAPDPPSLAEAAAALAAMTTFYAWDKARVAARRRYCVAANWKLVLENYHECYHCAPAHPEFSAIHALAQPGARRLGAQDFEAWGPAPDGREVARVMRSPLKPGRESGGAEGKMLAPSMNPAASDRGACVFAEVGFLSAFLAYPDHGLIYRFIPKGPLETDMEVTWLVAGETREGADYDLEALTWLWDVTSRADKAIIENNQAGVASRAYRPGPFSLMEPGTAAYVARYLGELNELLSRTRGGAG